MSRDLISRRALAVAVDELERVKPYRIQATWSAMLEGWRAELTTVDGATDEEIAQELAGAYRECWLSVRTMRDRMPKPASLRPARPVRSSKGVAGGPSGSFRAVREEPRVPASAHSEDNSGFSNRRSTSQRRGVDPLAHLPSVVSKSELAGLIDVTPRHVQRLADRGVVIRGRAGGFVLRASVQGYLAHARADAERRGGSAAETRLRETKLDAIQRSAARADRGEVAFDEVVETLDELVAIFTETLGGLPAALDRHGAKMTEVVAFAQAQLAERRDQLVVKLAAPR